MLLGSIGFTGTNNPINSWDAYTRGGCAIMPHMSAPVIGKLCAGLIYEG